MALLYKRNVFEFGMINCTNNRSPPSVYRKQGKGLKHFDYTDFDSFRPQPRKPAQSDAKLNLKLNTDFKQMTQQRQVTKLSGWIYYDPLLRWMHMIGPQCATTVKHISIHGAVKTHDGADPQGGRHGLCDEDLASTLTH